METIATILSRPKVQSISFTKKSVVVTTTNGISHTYSHDYFVEKILPKLTEKNEEPAQ